MSHVNSQVQIETDIEAQRELLADTVGQLAAKLDVKARARDRVADLGDAITTEAGRPRPVVLASAGILAVAVALVAWRRWS
jgi:hypothetical protein